MSLLDRVRGFPVPFLAVNALILACIYFLMIAPILDAVAESEAGLDSRRETLTRYRAVISQATEIANSAKRLTKDNDNGEFLTGDNEGQVAANLHSRLKAAADAAKVNVRLLQMLPTKTLQGSALTGARLEVTGSLPAIHSLTRTLETTMPLLLITEADLRPETLALGSTDDKNALIAAQFNVFAAAKPFVSP
ncbi:Type II secretion system (T2SS), protein M subtype b [Rhodoblastus acidophilus]|uniref:Type II secretion system (T2SS), protein M subtype b n=1 Tax=Rhodoblastus acidophilus TaxID=1074 RepID=A0A212SAN7_RHOAC|nr:type II secretion system protein GspM [Rhodoblastus acidophilus]PPQ35764.1 hypothetical protein CKO16_19755 [Rhodoblastus acidophilus]RAI19996.1 hypothetical protein CH337_10855 [Rhodoblastus acidophilus]SNB82560.1 Type II secretion system (T2SS), protein M subtype b [Rhodoblastus acidophilus]